MKLIICGGGARVSYLIGIKKYIEEKKIKIEEYAGSSSGSIFIVLMACGISNKQIVKEYQLLIKDKEYSNNYKFDIIRKYLQKVLPENADKICSNKVRISLSYFDFPFIKNKIVTNFKSKNHLIETILTSCCFPFFINKNLFYNYENKWSFDGFFSENTPLIEKNNSENQIIIKTYMRCIFDLDLFIYKKISKKMINQGYNDIRKFFEYGETLTNFMVTNNKNNTKLYIYFFYF